MKKLLLVLLFLSILISCENRENELKTKAKSVMQIHDDVMPKMDYIMEHKERLESILADSMHHEHHLEAREIYEKLDEADEHMMQWMRDYEEPEKDVTFEEAITYYQNQEVQISAVRNEMLTAISEAETFINQLENQ